MRCTGSVLVTVTWLARGQGQPGKDLDLLFGLDFWSGSEQSPSSAPPF